MPRSIVLGVMDIAAAAFLLAGCGGGSSEPQVPVARVDPSSLAFGSEQVGTTTTKTITLSNTGKATLTVSGITLGGTDAAMFSQTSTCGSSVAAGQSCVVRVSYKPASVGASSATLELNTNASVSPSVALTGTGVAAPTPRFLFAVANNEILAFAFDAAGKFTPIPGSPFASPPGGTFTEIAISHDSKFLYSVDGVSGNLLGFSIGSDGALLALQGAPFSLPDPYYNLISNPAADVIYAVSTVTGDVLALSIDSATGAVSQTSFAASVHYVDGNGISPDGRYLYLNSNDFPPRLSEFSLDSVTGALAPIPGSPISMEGIASSYVGGPLVVEPSGKFLYAINGYQLQLVTQCCVVGLQIDQDSGALTPIPGVHRSSFDLGGSVKSITASSGFLIADFNPLNTVPFPVYSDSCVVGVLSIDASTGVLTPVAGSPFPNLCGVTAAQPAGPYVYIADQGCSALTEYELNGVTGTLTAWDQTALSGKCVSSMALVR